MGFPETPDTDVDYIKRELTRLNDLLEMTNQNFQDRLDRQAKGINDIGLNMDWLVNNVQGIFQMFSNPAMMAQILGTISGGMANGGQAGGPEGGPDAGPEDGPGGF